MKRRGLGSAKGVHHAESERAVAAVSREAKKTIEMSLAGRCTAATMGYAEMQQAIGRFEAHRASAGSGGKIAWFPQSDVRDAAGAYNDHCVRVDGALGNGKKTAPPREPPPVYFPRQGPPPGVPMLKGRRGRKTRAAGRR